MKDPIYQAYDQDLEDARARAGDISPEAVQSYANQQVGDVQALAASIEAQRRREEEAAAAAAARAAAAQQQPTMGGAMGMPVAPQAAHLAFNPDTGTLMVNGQAMPHDIQAWHAAATADPAHLAPMDVNALRQYGFHPISQQDLAGYLGQVQEHATAPVKSNAAGGFMQTLRAIPQGISKLGSMVTHGEAALARKLGLDRVAHGMDEAGNMLSGVADDYSQWNKEGAQQRREGLTFEEQAGNDAGFTEHPGTYLAAKAATAAGGMAPGVAAFIANPALGVAAMTSQGAGMGQDIGEDRVRAQIENVSPEDMMRNPVYAQMRHQGMSDQAAREAMIHHAGDTGAAVGGALSGLTAPFYGRLGAGVLTRSAARGVLPAAVSRSFVARTLATGAENAALAGSTNAAIRAGASQQSGTDMGGLTSGAELGEQFAMGSVAGMFSPRHPAATDIGAAAGAVKKSTPQPTVETPHAPLPAGMVKDLFGTDYPGYPRQQAAPEAPVPQGHIVDPSQLPIDFQQHGMNGDMFGAPSPPRAAPEEPAPQPQPFNPDQLPLQGVPDVGPAPGPRGQLIRQRMMERRAAAQAPQGEPAALPPMGPTQGMNEHAASLQQSLDMVSTLLANGNFNKRTKSGKATIAKLQAEQQRLQAELQAAQQDVAGAEIGAARAERPEQPGATFIGDPASGQVEMNYGPGHEPGGDPRLTGQQLPAEYKPGTSVEPPPIPNPEPMSPQEAQARLAAQRARRPDRQEPQGDLFPKQLKQGLAERIAQGEQADNTLPAPETTPEPAVDLQAQADALGKSRDALFVAKGNEGQMPKVKRGVRKVVRDEGTLFTTSPAKAKAYRDAPQVNDALLARLQGLQEAKGAALAKGDTGVIAAEDAKGRVVKEAVGEGNAPAVKAAVPKGGRFVRRSAQEAQARRANLVAEEGATPAKRSRADQIKDKAAAKSAAKAAAGKKKVPATSEPVTAEELGAHAEPTPERVKAAHQTLIEDVKANHPHLLEESDTAPPKEKVGAGRDAIPAVIRLPLTAREMGVLTDRLHATAKAEAELPPGGRASVVRRVLEAAGLRAASDTQLHAVIRDIASMDRDHLHELVGRLHARLADSTLAKGIVRGMDVVQHAVTERDQDTRGRAGVREPEEPSDAYTGIREAHMAVPTGGGTGAKPELNQTRSTQRVKLYGKDLPENVVDVVGRWLHILDRDSVAMPRTVHVMTPDEAAALYGSKPGIAGVSGQLKDGSWFVAVDFKRLPEPAAMESLAHEMGHVTAHAIFDKAPPEQQKAVRAAFEDWLQATGRATPVEQMASRVPPALADLIRKAGLKPERSYAEAWNEWIADETAKWFLTSRKPRSVVERFFSKIAEALSKLYAQVEGRGRPTEAVKQLLDNWVERSRDLKGDDAAARAVETNYGRQTAEPPRPAEAVRSRIDARAMAARMEAAVNGAMNLRDQARAAVEGNPEGLRRSINTAITSVGQGKMGDVVRKASFALSNMNDIVGRYGGKEHGEFGAGLTRWDHAMRLAEKYSKEAQQMGQLALERAQRLSAPVTRTLEDLMYKSTVYGVHPDAEFGKGKNAHLRNEDPEVEAANARRYGEVKTLWDQLEGIPGNPQRVYQDMRAAMTKLHEDTFEARRNNIDSLDISAEAKEEGHRLLNMAEERMLEGPYFPLVREGSYITTARMPATRLGLFQTRAEAEQAGRRYKAKNPHAEIMPVEEVDGEFSAYAGEKAVYFHDSLKDALNAKASIEAEMREAWQHEGMDLDAAQTEAGPMISEPMTTVDFYRKAEVPTSGSFMAAINKLRDREQMDPQAYQQLAEMYVESLPETSPRKAFLRRENIRGANRRMLAGYGRRLLGAAHSYGQTKIATERNKAWAQMTKHRGDSPEYGQVMSDLFQRQEILAKRMQHNPLNTFASTIQDASSFMALAFSPAFALQQVIQPLVLSAPVLAARMARDGKAVGYGRTMDALKAAYEGAVPFFAKRGAQQWVAELKRTLGTYGGDGLTLQESANALIEKFGRSEDERDMLRFMNDRGTLDFSFLNAVNDATTLSAAGSKAKAIMRMSMAFPQQIEAMNRTITGLAAYRLAREARGMDHADAVREANQVVSQTHGDYSRYNRPSVFNRPLVGMALQFKMYTQFLYSLLVSNIAHALQPRFKGDREQAVRTLAYVLGSHAAIGGAVGLGPVAGAAKLALGGLMYAAAGAGLIDKKKKDQTINDWIAAGTEDWGDEMFGKGAGKTLRTAGTYGLPGLLGVDMADKIAIPDITDTRYTGRARASDQPGDVMDRVAITMLGPVYSNAKRVANGTGDVLHGDLKGAANQMLPSAPRAWLHAATEAQDGVVTQSGRVVRPKADMSPLDTAIRVLGLQPVKTAMAYDDRARVQNAIDRVKVGRSDLIKAYREADPEDRAAVLRDIAEFNQGRPPELQISRRALQHAVQPPKPSKLEAAATRAVE